MLTIHYSATADESFFESDKSMRELADIVINQIHECLKNGSPVIGSHSFTYTKNKLLPTGKVIIHVVVPVANNNVIPNNISDSKNS